MQPGFNGTVCGAVRLRPEFRSDNAFVTFSRQPQAEQLTCTILVPPAPFAVRRSLIDPHLYSFGRPCQAWTDSEARQSCACPMA
jgi:hypothetical protein